MDSSRSNTTLSVTSTISLSESPARSSASLTTPYEIRQRISSKVDEGIPRGFASLPTSILLRIFRYLKENDLRNVIQVCTKWKFIGLDPILWKYFKICNISSEQALSAICRRIWKLNKLEHIYIKRIQDVATILRQIATYLPNIKALTLRYCHNVSDKTLRYFIRECKHLEQLDLKGTSIKGYGFYDDLMMLKSLRSLNLSDTAFVNIKILFGIALNCHNLQELYIFPIKCEDKSYYFRDEDCSFLISNLSRRLTGLAVDGTNLTNMSFQRILQCRDLEKLAISSAYSIDGHSISNLWMSFKHLKSLKLQFAYQVSLEDFEMLFINGKHVMRNLELLDLSGCWKVSDELLKLIARCCTKLKKLHLKSCGNITNLSDIKERCKKLEVLNIAFCKNIILCTLFPLPPSLKTIYVHKGDEVSNIFNYLVDPEPCIKLKVCHSEYSQNYDVHRYPIKDQ